MYIEKSYYLAPDKGADRGYHLLVAAMVETGRAALARYTARGKQHLVMLRPAGGASPGLVMQQLHYAADVKSAADVPVPAAEVRFQDLALACQLVERMVGRGDLAAYRDEARARTEAMLQRKIDGEEIRETPAPAPGKVLDLMAALRASVAAKGAGDVDIEVDVDDLEWGGAA